MIKINKVVNVLKGGGLIVYPTETCYGLGADATNAKAIDKLLQYKGGRKGKPISVAVCDQKMAKKYIVSNPAADNIFKNLLPGPITVVCKGKHKVDPRLESSLGTLGIRIPKYPLVLKIISAFGKPITATSANVSCGKTPYQISDLQKRKEMIDLVIDAGKLPPNLPSVVVDTTQDQPEILRQGKIDFDKLKAKSIITNSSYETQQLAKNLLKKYLKDLSHKCLISKCLIFALRGELGTGKTQFAKGIGKALKIKQTIRSPTFTLINEYKIKNGIFYHLDAWRINSSAEFRELEVEKLLKPKNVIVIEWMEKGREILDKIVKEYPVKIIWMSFEHLGKTKRRIRFMIKSERKGGEKNEYRTRRRNVWRMATDRARGSF